MALVLGDSFDHYADADKATKWTQYGNNINNGLIAITAAIGARGTSGLRIYAPSDVNAVSGQLAVVPDSPAPSGEVCMVAFRFKSVSPFASLGFTTNSEFTTGGSGAAIMFRFRKTAATTWWANLNTNGTISIYRGTTLLGTTSTALTQGVYQWLEFKVLLSATVGTVTVKLNGITVLSLTNQNTSGGVDTWDEFRFGCVGSGTTGVAADWHIDDFCLYDGSGATWNDLQGDIEVDCILPDANGTTRDWTPSTGANDFAVTDEQLANGDVDYLLGTTLNDLVTMGYPAIVSGLVVKAVQLVAQTKKLDAGAAGLKGAVRIGAIDYLGTERGPGTTYSFLRQIWEVSPDSGVAWTEAEVNAAEFGVEKST